MGSLKMENCIDRSSFHRLDRPQDPMLRSASSPGLECVLLNMHSDPGIFALSWSRQPSTLEDVPWLYGRHHCAEAGMGGEAFKHLFCWAACGKLGQVREWIQCCGVLWEQVRRDNSGAGDFSIRILW